MVAGGPGLMTSPVCQKEEDWDIPILNMETKTFAVAIQHRALQHLYPTQYHKRNREKNCKILPISISHTYTENV